MNYDVDWNDDVLSDLADLWQLAPDRQAVTDAQARIDQLLGRDPIGHGRHVSEGLYQLRVRPLVVSYTIDRAKRLVQVTWVSYRP